MRGTAGRESKAISQVRDRLVSGIGWAVLALWMAGAAMPASADPRDVHLVVEVLDTKGKVPQDLSSADFEILEGSSIVPLSNLASPTIPAESARVVIYFEQSLASNYNIKRSAAALAALTRQLVEFGEVEIVTSAEEIDLALRSRDQLVLGEKLSRMSLTDSGDQQILQVRQRVLRDLRLNAPAPASLEPAEIAEVVVAGIEEEIELVRQRQDRLVAWASQPNAAKPSLLLWVVDGFDLDPVRFYVQNLDEASTRAVLRSTAQTGTLEKVSLETVTRDTSAALSALGWTVLPVAFKAEDEDDATVAYAPLSVDATGGSSGAATGGATTSAPGITLRPGSLFGRRDHKDEEPKVPVASYIAPQAPLRQLADASGGDVIATDQGLRDAFERFAGRFELSYRSSLPPEAGLEPIEVRSLRPGLRVKARRWISRGIPERVAAVRLNRLLAGIEEDGGFDVAAVLTLENPADDNAKATAQLEARLELRDLASSDPEEEWAGLDAAVFRVTLAVAATGELPQLHSEVVRASDLREQTEWHYRKALELPDNANEVGVLIEELSGGLWGGRRASVVQGSWAASGAEALPAPTVVEIVRPPGEVLRGRVKFETEVYDSQVTRVDFLLDDREVASKSRRPFTARLDLGRTPRRRNLTVVAYGSGDTELGRDSAILNGGGSGLEVKIVRPTNRRGTGWVDVEAEVVVPVERRLDRVLFFWNNQPVATVYSEPFRQRVLIDKDKPVGYVRVVALLDDGTVAEDVAFMNGPAQGEQLEVNLVELYVVVTDESGRPVRGLKQEEFKVREDGVPQDIATFSDASDLPLTLGMAIDSSASMFVKLPRVQNAASEFLRSTFSEQDRAFVVDFDSEPRLARSTTGSLDRILSSIDSLEANGRTALWESIVFSLVQLQGVRGRKALVVFSDGADEDDQFPFRSSFSIAKKMGVPIYLILMKKSPKKDTGLSLLVRSFTSRANRLVEATGGRVFYAKEYRDLGEVYDEIERELRSQYLLAYYPREPSRGESWRTVIIDVDRRGLKPRTLSGYWD